jgi:hypothetical protein
MRSARLAIACSLLALSGAVFGQTASVAPAAGATPVPAAAGAAGPSSGPVEPVAPARGAIRGEAPVAPVEATRRPQALPITIMGPDTNYATTAGTGLEQVLNSGAAPGGGKGLGRKVCPPGMENRGDYCGAPLGR